MIGEKGELWTQDGALNLHVSNRWRLAGEILWVLSAGDLCAGSICLVNWTRIE